VEQKNQEKLTFPESHNELLYGKTCATAATVLADGHLQMSPMWFEFDGYVFRLSTITQRQIYRNLKNRRTVSLCIIDEKESAKYIEVRGHVENIVTDEGFSFFRKLSERYTGTPDYPFHQEGEVRVIVTVAVDRKLCFAPM
jgi:PPOX class probable F420-dependent enzyme